MGADVAGIALEVGKNVTSVKKGDEVFGMTSGFIGGWAEICRAIYKNQNQEDVLCGTAL